MSTDLELFTATGDLMIKDLEQHLPMLEIIKDNLPAIKSGCDNFMKTQSQFMDNMLTVSHPSPIRNLRQILSEINRAMEALREANFNLKRKEIEIKKYQRQLLTETDELERELIWVEINDRETSIEVTKGYISGAIRKITNHIVQYNSILKHMGVTSFDEIDFEAEEERYHIMTAFAQAITAARSHGGIVDEGNHIYFYQIGINGAAAQAEISGLLILEHEHLKQGKIPPHELVLNFLNSMADKYKGCSIVFSQYKGMNGEITKVAAIKKIEDELN